MRRLTPLSAEPRGKKFMVFDIETPPIGEELYTFMIGAYDGETYDYWYSRRRNDEPRLWEEFLDYVFRKRIGLVFAHYGGGFDFLFLLDNLPRKYEVSYAVQGGRIIFLTLSDGNRKVKFVDSFNLLPDSLSRLSKAFGVTVKTDMPTMEDGEVEWVEYNRTDCVALWEVLNLFQKALNKIGGELKPTIASCAVDVWRRRFLDIELPHYDYAMHDIRKAYFGGRVEIFNFYGTDLKMYDVNSMYPTVMLDPMPVGRPRKVVNPPLDMEGVIYAEVDVGDIDYPVLPYRKKEKLLFPVGKFRGWWDAAELRKAKEVGYKIRTIEGWEFPRAEAVLRRYVEEIYPIKVEHAHTKDVWYYVAKLLLNSLYGKFGQRTSYKMYGVPFDPDEEMIVEETDRVPIHSQMMIACHVTTLSRLKLYSYFEEVILKQGKVYYCDTDSIVTDTSLDEHVSDALGDLELQGEIEEGIFVLPKLYYLRLKDGTEKKAGKGFMKSYLQGLSRDDYWRALNWKKGEESPLSFSTFKLLPVISAFKRFKKFVVYGEFKRSLQSEYSKRIPVGFSTRPICLSEI